MCNGDLFLHVIRFRYEIEIFLLFNFNSHIYSPSARKSEPEKKNIFISLAFMNAYEVVIKFKASDVKHRGNRLRFFFSAARIYSKYCC